MTSRSVAGVVVLLVAALLFAGCGGGGGVATPPPAGTGAVMARLADPTGSPLSNVTMSLAGATATSDAQGYVRLAGVPAATGALVDFSADGYISTSRSVDVIAGDEVAFDVTMAPVGTTQTIDTTQQNQVSHAGGSVTIPANAVVDAAGNPVSTARVRVTTARPTDTGYNGFFPGPFRGRPVGGGADGLLLSYGFVDVTLEDAAGNPLQLAQGQSAQITFPITPGSDPGTPTVPLWYYDRAQGIWIEEGTATRNDAAGVYQGSVTHLTPWNCDDLLPAAYKQVTVVDTNGNPVVGVWVTADGPGWRTVDVTDANGQVTLEVQPGSVFDVWIQRGRVVTNPVTETAPAAGQTVANRIEFDPAQATIALTWSAVLRQAAMDLDLHLTGPTTPRFHIYKTNTGSLSQSPYAALDADVTAGPGPEVISIQRLLPGTYRCAVHNYSGQTEMLGICNSGAQVTLDLADEDVNRVFTPPQHNQNHINNNVWLVFDLVVSETGSVTVTPIGSWGTTGDFHPAGG